MVVVAAMEWVVVVMGRNGGNGMGGGGNGWG